MIVPARAEAAPGWRAAAVTTDRVTHGLLLALVVGLAASITLAQGALLLLAAWLLARRRHAPPMAWPLLPVVLAFAAWALVAAVAAADPVDSLDAARSLVWLGTPYVVLAALPDARSARRFLLALFVAIAAVAALAVVQAAACPAVEGRTLAWPLAAFFRKCARARGFFSIYMTLGGVLMLVLVAVLPLLPRTPGRRLGFALGWLVGAAALALTFVRGAWLGFGLGIGGVVAGSRRRWVALALAAGLGLLLLLPGVLDRVRSIGDPSDPTARERIAMFEAGLAMLEERPILGVGPGQVRRWYPVHAPDYAVRRSTSHLHNTPLQVAVEQGVPGLVLWLLLFGGFLVRTVRILAAVPAQAGDERGLVLGALAAIVGFLLAGLFEYNFGDSEVWMVAASIMALPFVVERSWPPA